MPRLTKPVNAADHTLGPKDAPVTLLEYGDFECPYCGAAYPIVSQIVQQMGNRLRFAFRHFPLTQAHPYAMAAAEASEAADTQGKFWEMYDTIFQHQDELDMEHLHDFASSIGLNMEEFDQDMANHTFEGKVQDDFMSGVRSGVNGTPTFFINGTRYEGPAELNAMMQALEEAAETTQA